MTGHLFAGSVRWRGLAPVRHGHFAWPGAWPTSDRRLAPASGQLRHAPLAAHYPPAAVAATTRRRFVPAGRPPQRPAAGPGSGHPGARPKTGRLCAGSARWRGQAPVRPGDIAWPVVPATSHRRFAPASGQLRHAPLAAHYPPAAVAATTRRRFAPAGRPPERAGAAPHSGHPAPPPMIHRRFAPPSGRNARNRWPLSPEYAEWRSYSSILSDETWFEFAALRFELRGS
jgi:hypothetical protein